MEDKILRVIQYFGYFSFPPSLEEIHTFFEDTVTKKQLQEDINYLVTKKILIKRNLWVNHESVTCYTFIHKSFYFQVRVQREIIALQKLAKVDKYIRFLSWFPQIRFVGLSGSIAMNNTSEDDDIDLFIITATGRIWTARFITLIMAQVMKLRGTYNVDKVCLNMFFDEMDLQIPAEKRNEYIAHEIFQLKSYINKNGAYEKFIMQNKWAYAFFPNVSQKKVYRLKPGGRKWFGRPLCNLLERCLKYIQMKHLQKKNVKGKILDTQLWLFQEDFEKRIPLKLKRV